MRLDRKIKLSALERKDDGLRRAKKFIKDVANIPFPDDIPEWHDATSLAILRNLILHNDGRLPKDHSKKKEVDRFVKAWSPDIQLDEHQSLLVSPAFVGRAADVYYRFFGIFSKRAM